MINVAVIVFFGWLTARTGPAFAERRREKREREDRPLARVVYLPSASCRPLGCPDPDHCAICEAARASL